MTHWVQVILEDTVWGQRKLPDHVIEGLKRIKEMALSSDVVQFRTQEFEEIADELSICDDLNELSLLLWRAATTCGFQHFCLFVVNQGNSPTFASRMCNSYMPEWLEHYQRNSFQYVDPIFAKAKKTNGSFLFSEASNSSPVVQAFWEDAERYGVGRNGVCYVITRPDSSRIALSFSTCDIKEIADAKIRLNAFDLGSIAQLAIECFCYNSAVSLSDDNVLSDDELRFLHLLTTNSNPEVALSLIPTFGGNESIQSSIRRKLGVQTIFQAVSIACSKQWFDKLPFYRDEIVSSCDSLSGWGIAGVKKNDSNAVQTTRFQCAENLR